MGASCDEERKAGSAPLGIFSRQVCSELMHLYQDHNVKRVKLSSALFVDKLRGSYKYIVFVPKH